MRQMTTKWIAAVPLPMLNDGSVGSVSNGEVLWDLYSTDLQGKQEELGQGSPTQHQLPAVGVANEWAISGCADGSG